MFFSCLYGDLRIMKSERSEWNNSRLEPDSLTVRVFQAAKGVCKVGNRRNDQSDFLLRCWMAEPCRRHKRSLIVPAHNACWKHRAIFPSYLDYTLLSVLSTCYKLIRSHAHDVSNTTSLSRHRDRMCRPVNPSGRGCIQDPPVETARARKADDTPAP